MPQGADDHMCLLQRAALTALAGLCVLASSATAKLRLPRDYQAWSKVARCESGGWRVLGYAYPDSLGIDRINYLAFGGKPIKPGWVPMRTRLVEIRVADRLIHHYRISVPDRYGCAAW